MRSKRFCDSRAYIRCANYSRKALKAAERLRSTLCDGSKLIPQTINNINDIPPMGGPLFKTHGPQFYPFEWDGIHYLCPVSKFRKELYSYFNNADSAHPINSFALSKYLVTLGGRPMDGTPGGWSLQAASLSTVPCAQRGVHSSSSTAPGS